MNKVSPALIALLALVGCAAETNETARADRTVVITMRDNHFEPDEVEVKEGETVTFRFINTGKNRHDAFVGDKTEQVEHEKEAREGGGHEEHMGYDQAGVTVDPGKSATLVETFEERGETLIGCHEPGHYKGGMVVKVAVT